jgi:hypothetical protein
MVPIQAPANRFCDSTDVGFPAATTSALTPTPTRRMPRSNLEPDLRQVLTGFRIGTDVAAPAAAGPN